MKKMKDVDITTYQYDDNYLIDIVKNDKEGTYEAWIYHRAYGVKSMMFGVLSETNTIEFFLAMVEANAEDHIKNHTEERCD